MMTEKNSSTDAQGKGQLMRVHINEIGTATPVNDVHDLYLAIVPQMLSDERSKKIFSRLAAKSGIKHRYSTLNPCDNGTSFDTEGFYTPGAFPSTAARMARFESHAGALVDKALCDLNNRINGDFRSGLTHVIVTTCTGFAAPWMETQLIGKHGIDPGVERILVGFMGCNAAINAYKTARHIVRSEPTARVLIVNVELCTLHFQDAVPLETALTFMLFADGASAALVTSDPVGMQLNDFRSTIVSNSAEMITWKIGDNGFDMKLSSHVPRVIAQNLPEFLTDQYGSIDDFDLWAVHPGGSAILDAVERSCDLPDSTLDLSREILRDYGNMSSATLPFVLQRQLDQPGCGQNGIAIGFGPGVSIESMRFTEVAP